MARTAAPKLTAVELAAEVRVALKLPADAPLNKLAARMNGLGLTIACGRCGGSGHYSYCAMHGTTCFGCSGSGKAMPKLTLKVLAACRDLNAAGTVDAYLTALTVKQTRNAGIVRGIAEVVATWKGSEICKAYSAAYNREYTKIGQPNGPRIPQWLYNLQTEVNGVFERANQIGSALKYGKPTDSERDSFAAEVVILKATLADAAERFAGFVSVLGDPTE